MGEWSKKIGEHGEAVSKQLLNIIGWNNLQHGIDITCVKGSDHKKSEKPRSTHGMDFLSHHKSPLFDHTLQFACISSKFSADDYPNSPVNTFKSHIRDIETLIECFILSTECKEVKQRTQGVVRTQFAGVLIWLHDSNEPTPCHDLIEKLESIRFSGELELNHPIYVVDNRQAFFLFACHNYMKMNFSDYDVNFFYHKSGNNNSGDRDHKSSGKILPLEMITSKVIIYKAVNNNDIVLVFITDEPFSKESLKVMIGLAHDISSNLSTKINICFPDLNILRNENDIESIKAIFEDQSFTSRIDIKNYHSSLI